MKKKKSKTELSAHIQRKPSPSVAITVHQPWAWLIVSGHKDVENRSWEFPPRMLGKSIYIHAGNKRMDEADYKEFVKICKRQKIKNYPKSADDFEYGAVIGTVCLSGQTLNSTSFWAIDGENQWMLTCAKRIKSFKLKGQLGFFKVVK